MGKFVIFGRSHFQYNGFDSLRLIFNDIMKDERVKYVTPEDSWSFRWLNLFVTNHYARKWASLFGVPFRKKAYRHYLNCYKHLDKHAKNYFIFVRYEPWFLGANGFLEYLREQYPESKLVYILLNVNRYLNIDFQTFVPQFHLVTTIDEGDAVKYGLTFCPFYYSALEFEENNCPQSDCFYVGNAKARLNEILEIYEKLESEGLHCDFHIVNVPPEQQKYADKISYNRPLNYDEIVKRVQKTNFLLELMQEEQSAPTLRESEAVVYGKKLLTNNRLISERTFYSEEYMQYFEEIQDIDIEFLKRDCGDIVYPNRDQLSPRRMLEYLEKTV